MLIMRKGSDFGLGCRAKKMLPVVLVLSLLPCLISGASEEGRIVGIAGGVAELPCDTVPFNSARLDTTGNPYTFMLIVWYKDEVPVYSWDARDESKEPSHWSSATLESRATWIPRPPRLALRPARPKDAGKYKCRVDFKSAPSRSTVVHLTIIEPPATPRIFDEEGREVVGRAGPYREGDKPVFNCVVTGGNPPPTIRWFRGEEMLASNEVISSKHLHYPRDEMQIGKRDTWQKARQAGQDPSKKEKLTLRPIGLPLRLPPLKRQDLLATFSCRVNNSRLLPTLSTSITVDMQLPPLTVEIEHREALRAGHKETVTCRATGARPPASISWSLHGIPRPANTFRQEESETADISTSILDIIVGREQRGQQLACKASHTLLPEDASLSTTLTLDVLLPPDVSLQLGRDTTFDNIIEGDAVTLDCAVLAHPPPYKISWEHNGRSIAHDIGAGIEIDWGQLMLPKIQKSDGGTYNCIASNVEGDTRSNTLSIQVLYPPVCRRAKELGTVMIDGIHQIEMLCEVDSNPPPSQFAWAINTTTGLMNVLQEHYSWSDTTSNLRYIPSNASGKKHTEAVCWATNKIGRQLKPCSLPLHNERPTQPQHCALHNLTYSEFSIICDPGDNITKSFELVVKSSDGQRLVNLTTNQPVFKVNGLPGGKELRLLLYAKNERRCSEPVELFIIMPHPTYKNNTSSIQSVLLLGITFGALLIFLLTIIFLKCKDKLSRRYRTDKPRPIVTAVRDEDCPTVIHEERNPDVVPLNKVEQDELAQMRAEQKWEVAARSPRLQEAESPPLLPPKSETSWSIRSLQGREVVTSRTPLPATQESCV